ncbi:MAG: type II secretion system F family protein [Peptococcaceae bacterium]|jgi:hypothetical protein|nr:type II secretion system F family protein [Peptococcaceae bacterium]MDH7526458.1 type II secretion system F family protein [Peptococcaceae bacterium]
MLPVAAGLLFGVWFVISFFLFYPPGSPSPQDVIRNKKLLEFALNLHKYQAEAQAVGWQITRKEVRLILLSAVLAAAAVSYLTRNPFVPLAGLVAGYYLPGFLIRKKKHSLKLNMITGLTDPLRMLLSRLPDQQNVTRAIESARDNSTNPSIRKLFDAYVNDVALGGSTRDALCNLKRKVGLRKFDLFVDNLIQAHYEGFTAEAIKALDKAVEAMEFDLLAVNKVKAQSRNQKRKLYLALGTAWLFPPILSLMNTGAQNVYLNTIQGKVLMLFYIAGTIYVYVKGEDYLSLNLDEL